MPAHKTAKNPPSMKTAVGSCWCHAQTMRFSQFCSCGIRTPHAVYASLDAHTHPVLHGESDVVCVGKCIFRPQSFGQLGDQWSVTCSHDCSSSESVPFCNIVETPTRRWPSWPLRPSSPNHAVPPVAPVQNRQSLGRLRLARPASRVASTHPSRQDDESGFTSASSTLGTAGGSGIDGHHPSCHDVVKLWQPSQRFLGLEPRAGSCVRAHLDP
jgi:hypothetical protein